MRHLTCDYLSVYKKLRKICETLVCSVLSRHDHVGQRSTRQTTRPYNSLSAGHASQHSNKMQNIQNKLTPSTKQAQMNTLRGHLASCLNLATWDSEVAKSCGQAIAKRDFHGSFDPSWSELAVWVGGLAGRLFSWLTRWSTCDVTCRQKSANWPWRLRLYPPPKPPKPLLRMGNLRILLL